MYTDTWCKGTAQPAKRGELGPTRMLTYRHNYITHKFLNTNIHRAHSTWCERNAQLLRTEFRITFMFNFYYCLDYKVGNYNCLHWTLSLKASLPVFSFVICLHRMAADLQNMALDLSGVVLRFWSLQHE